MLPKDLIEKYQTWKGDTFLKNKDRFEKLAEEGQSPQYMIISCVDSRVDPNSIFNALRFHLALYFSLKTFFLASATSTTFLMCE